MLVLNVSTGLLKKYPQVSLEQRKYRVKKREAKRFIDDYEIDLDSDYESG